MLMTEIVVGMLVVGTIIIAILTPRFAETTRKEIWLRTRSWWVMVGVTLLSHAATRPGQCSDRRGAARFLGSGGLSADGTASAPGGYPGAA